MGRHRLASKIHACARAQSPRAAHGLNGHIACAIGGWSRGARRSSDEGCDKRLTPRASVRAPPGPKKSKTGLRLFSPASTPLRKLEGLPFRAAIGDRQAVYWWLLGHELSFQAKSLGSRPRSSNQPLFALPNRLFFFVSSVEPHTSLCQALETALVAPREGACVSELFLCL